MEKLTINVPVNVKRITDWVEYSELIPTGKIILNKRFPGCGMTYYYLHSDKPVILCSPRKLLLKNKTKQMEKEGKSCFYYDIPEDYKPDTIQNLYEELDSYMSSSSLTPGFGRVPKILCTNDSFYHIYDYLKDKNYDLSSFQVVVDEFQVIFQDYHLKPTQTETFYGITEKFPNIIYLSATPMLEEYLEMSEYYRDLLYVELDWSEERIKDTLVSYKPITNTVKEAVSIIEKYKESVDKVFCSKTVNGVSYDSKEAVFFINDVSKICSIIDKAELTPSEVNILVADTKENRKRITKKLGKNFTIGTIPLEGEAHKTYTFCSRTVFFGCDFYSTSASTYIFADAHFHNMATDISLDLPQIVGRQRLESNMFRNECTVFVVTSKEVETEEKFNKYLAEKDDLTEKLYSEFSGLSKIGLNNMSIANTSYVVKYNTADKDVKVKISDISRIAEIRAWKIRNKVYKSHEVVKSLILDGDFELKDNSALSDILGQFYANFMIEKDTAKKMYMFCGFLDEYPEFTEKIQELSMIPSEYKNYYFTLGSERIKKNSYILSRISKEYNDFIQNNVLEDKIYKEFTEGSRISNKDLKEKLKVIYASLGLNKTAKASDIEEYFEAKRTRISVNGKQIEGLELIKSKLIDINDEDYILNEEEEDYLATSSKVDFSFPVPNFFGI